MSVLLALGLLTSSFFFFFFAFTFKFSRRHFSGCFTLLSCPSLKLIIQSVGKGVKRCSISQPQWFQSSQASFILLESAIYFWIYLYLWCFLARAGYVSLLLLLTFYCWCFRAYLAISFSWIEVIFHFRFLSMRRALFYILLSPALSLLIQVSASGWYSRDTCALLYWSLLHYSSCYPLSPPYIYILQIYFGLFLVVILYS